MTETKPPPCVWCDRDIMDTHASFNGKDICIICEERANGIPLNDTTLSWTDADLEDACNHAQTGGIGIGREDIMHLIRVALADHQGKIHETRIDSKEYKYLETAWLAIHAIFTKASQLPAPASDYLCNCDENEG